MLGKGQPNYRTYIYTYIILHTTYYIIIYTLLIVSSQDGLNRLKELFCWTRKNLFRAQESESHRAIAMLWLREPSFQMFQWDPWCQMQWNDLKWSDPHVLPHKQKLPEVTRSILIISKWINFVWYQLILIILDSHPNVLPTPQREAWHGIVVASPRRLRRSPQWLGHHLGSVETCDCQVIVTCFQQIWRWKFAVDLIFLTYTWPILEPVPAFPFVSIVCPDIPWDPPRLGSTHFELLVGSKALSFPCP